MRPVFGGEKSTESLRGPSALPTTPVSRQAIPHQVDGPQFVAKWAKWPTNGQYIYGWSIIRARHMVQLQPLVPPQVLHFMQVPFLTSV